ncbi:hypothetical protein BDY19DRAFT_34933 [Irpex rosettiformis]|uniref:Uncharacterized protein n=1 Tax=Irpex rosettiformis TaxID=378272 RepID=A0ACB8UKE2_9APHY|nr:hypothetical protein BDY19DRAFT_34933 [Irpex rosettiformis]
MQPSLDLHTQAQVAVSSPKLSQREPSTPPSTKPPKYSRASPAAEVKTEDLTPAVDAQEPLQLVMNPSSHRIQSPVHGRKSLTEDKRRPSSPSCPPLQSNSLPKASRPSEDTQFRHQDAVHPKDEVQASAPVRKRKKVEGKSLLKEKAAAKPVKAATHDPVPFAQPHSLTVNRAEVTEDDDPHDWLMEHYGGASTSHASHHHGASRNTVVEEKLFSSRPALSKDESSRDFGSTDDASARTSVQTVKRVLKDSKDVHVSPRMRSSTPTAMFEEEIGPVEVDQHARAPTIKSHRGSTHSLQGMKARVADVDMDLDAELDLVAGPRGTDVDATLKIDNTSEMDVEDELLSLLDDNPRPHKGSSHTHPRLEGLDLKAISPAPSAHTPTEQMLLTYSSANKSKHTTKRAEKSDRESMPPPSHTPDLAKAQDLTTSKKGEAAASANVKKKDGTVKKQTPAKPKVSKTTSAPKAAGKASGKEGSSTPVPSASNATLAAPTTSASGKVRKTTSYPAGSPSGVGAAVKRAVSSVTGGVSSRSRSTSVMPGAHDTDKAGDKKAHDGPEEEPVVDDKLYCICKTKYDEDRVMIACDRCDEWYHTQCVNMPDLEVDLVDQFICPICIANNPHLLLKTTYKQRCYSGVNHPHPSSPAACHKPARGAVSKYCSDDCAVKNMQSKIRRWGGDKAALWEGVKDADKREAVVMKCLANGELDGQQDNKASKWNEDGSPDSHVQVVKPSRTKIQREIDRLNSLLSRVPVRRNALKKEEEILLWREHLVELAIARADMMGECGWDQRLCFGDHEIAEFGSEVLKSYDNFGDQGTPDAMQVDGNEEWWCRGKKKCDRHAGWQKLRQAETELDKEVLNAGLDKITAEERDLRNRIEDIFKETSTSSNFGHKESSSDNGFVPLKLVNGDSPAAVDLAGVNCARTKVNGTGTDHRRMKGKKRKPE